MCGISGIFGRCDPDGRRRRVARMTRALIHRGPDDEGFFEDERVSFGFRRLSVIDLETGQQPIVLTDGPVAIVLNGEIYNFAELRMELEAKGHRFRSRGDVEVVLRLYAEEGLACLARLNGMFALALWDGREQVLHLARDRFGIKPLYWCSQRGEIGFASEIGALFAGGFPKSRDLDRAELRHYLALGFTSPGGTLLRDVKSVAPANVLSVNADGATATTPYWRAPETSSDPSGDRDLTERLRQTLAEAVERQLVADVPVGVFLSGGVDSSTVSAFAKSAVSDQLTTFSVGFEGPGAVSELAAARVVADDLGSDHHELMMDPVTVSLDLDAILGGLDSPLADPTAIPTWYMSKLARKKVTVALSGEGADEIFGGYERQRFDVAIDRFGALGRRSVPWAMRLLGRTPSNRLLDRVAMAPGLARQLHWGRVFTADQIDGFMSTPLVGEASMMAPYVELDRRWKSLDRSDPINGRLTTDREIFLPGDLLPKVDRMSMAHSLEVRVPFLDNEVVDLVLPLAGRHKASLFRDKRLLRRAVEGVIPQTTATRRKQAFAVPIDSWLRGSLRQATTDLLSVNAVEKRGLFAPEAVDGLLRDHLEGRRDCGLQLWTLMVLESWLRGLEDSAGSVPP